MLEELGVEPSAQTRALYEQLSRGELPPGLVPAAVTYPSPMPASRLEDEPPAPGEPPYKGLQCYEEADVDLFFGREALTARLVAHLRDYPFLTVIGTSGSGKSSIVRAGLIPALRGEKPLADGSLPPEGSRNWPVHLITPTAHPLRALAVSLTRQTESLTAAATMIDDLAHEPRSLGLAAYKSLTSPSSPGGGRLLLVVDQFEELFTLCRDENERKAFVDNLMSAVEVGGVVDLVIALRADFYGHCAQYGSLRQELAEHQEYIGSMSAEEVRRIIDEPARRGGWAIELGLVDLMVREVAAEPGALPLLSHALLETWKRRRGRTLLLAGYAESGGVSGAIARTAESVYQRLNPRQQQVARQVFMRLTELGESTGDEQFPPLDTRRRALLTELTSISPDATLARKFIEDYEAHTGEKLSFTGYLILCLARAVDENKAVQAYRKGSKQLVVFDDVDVGFMIELKKGDKRVLTGHVIPGANRKTYWEIHQEIRSVQSTREPPSATAFSWFWTALLLPWPLSSLFKSLFRAIIRRDPTVVTSMAGTVGISSVGMFGKGHAGWGIASGSHVLDLVVGDTARKLADVEGRIEPRDILSLTIIFDHDVIDGAPAARFTRRLVELIESGYGLDRVPNINANDTEPAATQTPTPTQPVPSQTTTPTQNEPS